MDNLKNIKNGLSFIGEKIENLVEYPNRKYIRDSMKTDVVVNPTMIARANEIVQKIVNNKENQKFLTSNQYLVREYSYEKDLRFPWEDNASMKPDGRSIATSNNFLSKLSDNDLLFIMGHEIAHAELKHKFASKQIEKQTGDRSNVLKYTRIAEHEADLAGAFLAVNAGGDLDTFISIFQKKLKSPSMIYSFENSHPTYPERMKVLKESFKGDVLKKIDAMKIHNRLLSNISTSKDTFKEVFDYVMKQSEDIRKGYKETSLDFIKKYIQEDPQRRGMQVYLDTKDTLSRIHSQQLFMKISPKLVPEIVQYSKKELEMGEKLANEVLKLPEVSVFKGFGMAKNMVELKAKDKAKEIYKGRV